MSTCAVLLSCADSVFVVFRFFVFFFDTFYSLSSDVLGHLYSSSSRPRIIILSVPAIPLTKSE